MTNSRLQIAIRKTTLNAADRMHEAVRVCGSLVTPDMLDTMIEIAILEERYTFENEQAQKNFSKSVIKNLKKDFFNDFKKVYSNRNQRVLI